MPSMTGSATSHEQIGLFFEGATLSGRPEPTWSVSTLFRCYDAGSRGIKHLFGVRIIPNNLLWNAAEAVRVVRATATMGCTIDLIGYSRGAVAAATVARRLAREGRPVRFLGLIDPVARDVFGTPGWFLTHFLANVAEAPVNVRHWWVGVKQSGGGPWFDPIVFPTRDAWHGPPTEPPFGKTVYSKPCDHGRIPDHNRMAGDSVVRADLLRAARAAGAAFVDI
jgi:hypothetical protein